MKNRRKRRKTRLFLCVALALMLTACSSGIQTNSPGAQQPTSAPIELTDALERTVTIDEIPERIVSGYYMSTSMLISLGLEDNLVGIESKADTRPIYKLAAPELLEVPSVGTMKEFNLEGCIALEPDLVVLPSALKENTEGLLDLGFPVLYVNPENQEDYENTMRLLGSATGTQERAEEILSYASRELESLNEKLSDVEQKSVYLGGNSAVLSTAGSKMYQNTLIENAGAVNVASDIEDVYWANVSYENVLAYDPDFIMIAAAATYGADEVLSDNNIANLEAIKNGMVAQMPGNVEAWDSPVPGAFLGSLWLASELYPENYTEAEFEAVAKDFYNTFYDSQPQSFSAVN